MPPRRDWIERYRIGRKLGRKRRCSAFGCKPDKNHPSYPNIWFAHCKRCGGRFVP